MPRPLFQGLGALFILLFPLLASSAEDGTIPDNIDHKEILRLLRDQQQELAVQRQLLRLQEQKIAALSRRARRDKAGAKRSTAKQAAISKRRGAPAATTGARSFALGNPSANGSMSTDLRDGTRPDVTVTNAQIPDGERPARSSGSSAPTPVPGPVHPVGQAPAPPDHPPEVQVLADVGGVLTRKGTLTIEPYAQYIRSTSNNFSFEGVAIADAVLIGQLSANKVSNDLAATGVTARYGITNRLEGEIKLPYVYRSSHITQATIDVTGAVSNQNASGAGIGDVEAALHYQINRGEHDWPFFIANLRYKSDTGKGPFDVGYNSNGSAQRLPTGSGFNAINPSVTVIYPSDPAVLFANVGWIRNFGHNVGKTVATAQISDVEPGDTYQAAFGMGVALNERLAFTLGYEHDYIQGTREIINNVPQTTSALQVGQALFGLSFKADQETTVNMELAAGVTRDAPDAQLTLRVPMSFNLR